MAAGIEMPANPTWTQIRDFAAQLHDRENEVYGVCMRGKAGWGENMAVVGTNVNALGERWFDESWQPQLDSPEWKAAIDDYVDLVTNYGPPGASNNGHNENRALFADGKCSMWVDATSAAGYIYTPEESTVADRTAFVAAPTEVMASRKGWLWAWALAVPTSSQKVDAAKSFLQWATSAEYVTLVGEQKGWVAAPPGIRTSLYENPAYTEAAPFATTVQQSILAADPANPTREPVPYTGIQFVAIPEFQAIGTAVGQQISAAVAGQATVDEALAAGQDDALREMQAAGYIQ